MRQRSALLAGMAAALIGALCLGCSRYPVAADGANLLELESVWQYLKAYSIWQDSIPLAQDPFVFDSTVQLLASVNDTFHGYNYTRYTDDTLALPQAKLAAVAAGAESTTVLWSRITDSTAYVRITEFKHDTTDSAFRSAMPFFSQFPKLIVDLRSNLGGDIDAVDSILEYFLPANTPFISAKYRAYDDSTRTAKTVGWEQWTTKHDHSPTLVNAHVAVLTNGLSASASEILVAGLKDGRRGRGIDTAILVGETTFGKGIGQIVISRSYLGKRDLKITFLRLKGISDRIGVYHRKGIAPDVQATNSLAQLNAALLALEPSAQPLTVSLPMVAAGSAIAEASVRVPADPRLEK
jgi:hypothetical protein